MAHFAQIDSNNIVQQVLVVHNSEELSGQAFLNSLGFSGTWIQTSCNTKGGVHYGQDNTPDGGVALRKNFAGIGYTYDPTRDAFIPPKPANYTQWVLDETTCYWKAPIEYPSDGYVVTTLAGIKKPVYIWDELTTNWIPISSVPALSSKYYKIITPYTSYAYGIGTLSSINNHEWDSTSSMWVPMSALPNLSAYYFNTLAANS